MAATTQQIHLQGFSRCLIHNGVVDEQTILEAQGSAATAQIPLVTWLISEKKIPAIDIARAGSVEFGLPLLDLDALDIDRKVAGLVDENLTHTHRAIPLFLRGNRLFIGLSDPTNQQALKEIKFNTGYSTEGILVEDDKLGKALEKLSAAQDSAYGEMLEADLEDIDVIGGEADQDLDNLDVDDAPVVRYVNKILLDAINGGASDIHFEPYEKNFRVRYRQDGILSEVANPPVSIASRLTARLKVMARLNIAERRVPQDGRIKMKISRNRAIDFRVNTCPTLYGEKIVLRILDPASANLGIEALGFEEDQKRLFEEAIYKPYGMILVTGPTGSGKTVSLYTALNILNEPGINISTAEDPVEIQVTGINQVNINTATGLTFAEALRAFLRQDPDIVMVGEIRDLETGEIAVKAAQTGHLVLSTLHTNDAPQTLTRLANMGIPPFNIASSVNLIMAQRLARRLCPKCKKPTEIPDTALLEEGFNEQDIADGLAIYQATGCDSCTDGYKGRVGIFEVLPVSESIGQLIMEDGNSVELKERALAEGDYYDLRTAGLKKVKAGITSLEEINRVTKE